MKFTGSKALLLISSLFCLEPQALASSGGEEKPKAAAKKPIGEDYRTVLGRLQASSAKIKEAEDKIKVIIHHKHSAPDAQHREALNTEMVEEYKKLTTVHRDFQKDLNRIKYEYPDRGSQTPRHYLRLRLKSLEELEHGSGLEADLEKTKIQLRKTYGEMSAEEKKRLVPKSEKDEPAEDDELALRPTLRK